MKKGFTVVEFLIVITILAIIGVTFIGLFTREARKENMLCSDFANNTIENVPVRCYDYYNIN